MSDIQKVAADWLRDMAFDARTDDASVGIFRNDELSDYFLSLIDMPDELTKLRAELARVTAENATLTKMLRQVQDLAMSRTHELEAARRDAERMDWLESMKHMGIGLISDDNGHYAVTGDGYQNVPMTAEPCDIQTTFFVEAGQWKNSAREAIDDYIAAMKEQP